MTSGRSRGTGGVDLPRTLIEAAARLIGTEGASAATLRRVAEEAGTSTMAVYTHFGGMPELRRAVRREGFERLAAQLACVDQTEDPVADVTLTGLTYNKFGIHDPHLYRVMFMEQPLDEADAETGWDTFNVVVERFGRCVAAGRFAPADPDQLAKQYWMLGHGALTLQLAQLISPAEGLRLSSDGTVRLFISYGDDPEAVIQSVARAGRRAGLGAATDAFLEGAAKFQ